MPHGAIPFPFGNCRICDDRATGFHFGVATCEGCKSFFKRSLPKRDRFVCYFGGQCAITPLNRNRCKACRFRRCLDNGMAIEAVKMGRIPKLEKERALKEAEEGAVGETADNFDPYEENEMEFEENPPYGSEVRARNDAEMSYGSTRPFDQRDNTNNHFLSSYSISSSASTDTIYPNLPDRGLGGSSKNIPQYTSHMHNPNSASDALHPDESHFTFVQGTKFSGRSPHSPQEPPRHDPESSKFPCQSSISTNRNYYESYGHPMECSTPSSSAHVSQRPSSWGRSDGLVSGESYHSNWASHSTARDSSQFSGRNWSWSNTRSYSGESYHAASSVDRQEQTHPMRRRSTYKDFQDPNFETVHTAHSHKSDELRSSISQQAPYLEEKYAFSSDSSTQSHVPAHYKRNSQYKAGPASRNLIECNSHNFYTTDKSAAASCGSQTSYSSAVEGVRLNKVGEDRLHDLTPKFMSEILPGYKEDELQASAEFIASHSDSLANSEISYKRKYDDISTPYNTEETYRCTDKNYPLDESSIYENINFQEEASEVVDFSMSPNDELKFHSSRQHRKASYQSGEQEMQHTAHSSPGKNNQQHSGAIRDKQNSEPNSYEALVPNTPISTSNGFKSRKRSHSIEHLNDATQSDHLGNQIQLAVSELNLNSDLRVGGNGTKNFSNDPLYNKYVKDNTLHEKLTNTYRNGKISNMTESVKRIAGASDEHSLGPEDLSANKNCEAKLATGNTSADLTDSKDSLQTSDERKPPVLQDGDSSAINTLTLEELAHILNKAFDENMQHFKSKYQHMDEFLKSGAPLPAHPISAESKTIVYKLLIGSINEISAAIVGFCSCVPGVSAIPKADKDYLTKRAYYDIWMLANCRMFHEGEAYTRLSDGTFYTREWMENILNKEIVKMFFIFAKPFNSLRLSQEELAILCAIQLTSPGKGCDSISPVGRKLSETINSRLLDLLIKKVTKNHSPNGPRVLVDIFRLLPDLAEINALLQNVIANFSTKSCPDKVDYEPKSPPLADLPNEQLGCFQEKS